jgi:hypothetical protein
MSGQSRWWRWRHGEGGRAVFPDEERREVGGRSGSEGFYRLGRSWIPEKAFAFGGVDRVMDVSVCGLLAPCLLV